MLKVSDLMISKVKGVGQQLNQSREPDRLPKVQLKELPVSHRYGLILRGVEVGSWETVVSWSMRRFMPRIVLNKNESRRRTESTHRWAQLLDYRTIVRSHRHIRTPLKTMQVSVKTWVQPNCRCVLITAGSSAKLLGPQLEQGTKRRQKITREIITAQCNLIHCPLLPCLIRVGWSTKMVIWFKITTQRLLVNFEIFTVRQNDI